MVGGWTPPVAAVFSRPGQGVGDGGFDSCEEERTGTGETNGRGFQAEGAVESGSLR